MGESAGLGGMVWRGDEGKILAHELDIKNHILHSSRYVDVSGKNMFSISPENICCSYSLEVPWRGASDKDSKHLFPWRLSYVEPEW